MFTIIGWIEFFWEAISPAQSGSHGVFPGCAVNLFPENQYFASHQKTILKAFCTNIGNGSLGCHGIHGKAVYGIFWKIGRNGQQVRVALQAGLNDEFIRGIRGKIHPIGVACGCCVKESIWPHGAFVLVAKGHIDGTRLFHTHIEGSVY